MSNTLPATIVSSRLINIGRAKLSNNVINLRTRVILEREKDVDTTNRHSRIQVLRRENRDRRIRSTVQRNNRT